VKRYTKGLGRAIVAHVAWYNHTVLAQKELLACGSMVLYVFVYSFHPKGEKEYTTARKFVGAGRIV
jgi:hypothetical protein